MNKKIKVLIIDDEETFCKTLEKFLQKEGYVPYSLHNGMDVTKYVENKNPDIVLLDIRMPGIDGIETLKRIRKINEDCVVIMLTAVDDIEAAISAFKEGADGFIRKPVSLKEFKVSMESSLEKRRLVKEREKLILELQGAMAQIKTLKGLIPICASCKKIRDDKGFWNQIEAYIENHSEAEFTHSICQECAKKLYPELYKL